MGGGIIADQLDELAAALALLRRLGICPIVVHGGGPQLTDALDLEGIECEWVDGKRVTTPEVLTAARRVFQNVGVGLSHALAQRGVTARPIVSGVFEARVAGDARLGLVGSVDRVELSAIEAAIDLDCVPIVSPLGETASGQILNIKRGRGDAGARERRARHQGRVLDAHGRAAQRAWGGDARDQPSPRTTRRSCSAIG